MAEGKKPKKKKKETGVLAVLFVSLVLDLMAFAVILPLFPRLVSHYASQPGAASPAFTALRATIGRLENLIGASHAGMDVVLFGGLLGSLFSLLQFATAPLFGTMSDRFGRRPTILVSAVGITVSYAIWLVSHSFDLFLLARVVAGLSKGNIHVATAVVGDVTKRAGRSGGMAIIGIAFSIGFVVGPLVGVIFTRLEVAAGVEAAAQAAGLGDYLHPFSGPAAFAAGLSLLNVLWVALFLPETRVGSTASGSDSSATPAQDHHVACATPFSLAAGARHRGFLPAAALYFSFLWIFSGTEFTLTFVTMERFDYSHGQQGRMFATIGLVMALTQGFYVRRMAKYIGDKALAVQGVAVLVPALAAIGLGKTETEVYVGVVLMALSGGTVVPCLTSLVTCYVPANVRGQYLGLFRSVGALARAFGPLTTCFLYWRLGSYVTYVLGAAALAVPLGLFLLLPAVRTGDDGNPKEVGKEE